MPFTGPSVHAGAASTDGNNVTTAGIDTTGATLLVLMVASWSAINPTITDSKGNVWVALAQAGDAGGHAFGKLYYCLLNPIVGAGHTFTASSTGGSPSLDVAAFAGNVFAVDQSSVAFSTDNSGVTTKAPGSITPSKPNELIITGMCAAVTNGATVVSVDGGFTITDSNSASTTAAACGLAYLIQTAVAAANPLWTTGGSVPNQIAVAVASFRLKVPSMLAVF